MTKVTKFQFFSRLKVTKILAKWLNFQPTKISADQIFNRFFLTDKVYYKQIFAQQ